MFNSLVICVSIVLLCLAVWPSSQRLLLRLTYRILQVIVCLGLISFTALTIAPELLPNRASQWLVSNDFAQLESLTQSSFWLVAGLAFSGGGIACLVALRHMCELPQVSGHLTDIKQLVANVGDQVSHVGGSPSERQGMVRRAVETMHDFFRHP